MSIKAVNRSGGWPVFRIPSRWPPPSYLGRCANSTAIHCNEPQARRATNALSSFDALVRDRLSPIVWLNYSILND